MKRKGEESGAEGDVDREFLDRVLNQLYDFGEGRHSKRSKKKSDKRRKRRGEEEEDDEEEEEELNEKIGGVKADSSGATVVIDDSSHESQNPVPARQESDVEIVTFLDPLKKNKPGKPETNPPEVKDHRKNPHEALSIEKVNQSISVPLFDYALYFPTNRDFLTCNASLAKANLNLSLRTHTVRVAARFNKRTVDGAVPRSVPQARLDVHRFGLAGFQKPQQRVFEQERAIMLGARPPKKEYVNYRVYQNTIKEKKAKDAEEVKSRARRTKKKAGKRKADGCRAAPSGREPAGLLGRFKGGVLLLNRGDIQKVTSKRRK
ncbi:hypothetical protein P4O66_019946 [Electrophorus voltai]|uniref:Uncharacterized protein n=1 Tax=Electrophorus voltai TaxID=2609070 RepID=A0AAD9E8C5_9TELE|nr:hypothetical protein P4O66_019946 [Electrophorus voltai]